MVCDMPVSLEVCLTSSLAFLLPESNDKLPVVLNASEVKALLKAW